jgi:phosphoglucomutase
VHYWSAIADRHRLDLSVVSEVVDPRFAFMTLDWDGQIRMDPSSSFAMQRLVKLKDRFDIAFACDTDHDRHGIVTPKAGLLQPNNYLALMVDHLFGHRPQWPAHTGVGKTVVTTQLIERLAARLGRRLFDMPVGFKWFVDGLQDASIGFAGEESAGATFLRRDGSLWTTDKDGITAALLSAEITARSGCDLGESYDALTGELGRPFAGRISAAATPAQKQRLAGLSPQQIASTELAGEKIDSVLSHAPGNGAPIGGIKVSTERGWFAARPSGTEDIYKIYAESFASEAQLGRLLEAAQEVVDRAL